MTAKFSMEELLAHFEAQMAFHKTQEAHHAEQEALHKERKEFHAAEHETVARHFEAFKATAEVAFGIASRMAPVSDTALQALPPGKPVIRSRLVAKVLEEMPQGEVFGASQLAAEVNRRFGKAPPRPGRLRPHRGSLYEGVSRGAGQENGEGSRLDERLPALKRQPAGQSVTARKAPQVVGPLKLQGSVGATVWQ
jgi:hypothetical protein